MGPGASKPAASAASCVANQTSASVWSYQGDSGVWYFFESSLPLISNPWGAQPAASGACEPSPYGASVLSTAASWTSSCTSAAGASAFLAAFLAVDFLAARLVAP